MELNPKINSKLADSLIVSIVNLGLSLSAILLVHTTYSSWTVVVCWILLPPLLVILLFFSGRDWLQGRRKQALEALLVSMPVVSLETWFFTHLRL